eukprot:TRINITY_DN9885_c0_g1_i1.p2 TRINITY_DN9885_c0_g1~~TRINITY_DN9885_c0_g1_i1.p2  ORF type:complete len:214 (+),score=41.60 TRINITY_DN9885_c0_g1_i1:244-885(+)
MGERFIVRDKESGRALMHHTTGQYKVKVPPNMGCEGAAGLDSIRPPRERGILGPRNSLLQMANPNPCDLVASWVYPARHALFGSEKWVGDLGSMGGGSAEFTFDFHKFNFRLPDGRLADSYTVLPLSIPQCDNSRARRAAAIPMAVALARGVEDLSAIKVCTAALAQKNRTAVQVQEPLGTVELVSNGTMVQAAAPPKPAPYNVGVLVSARTA